MQADGVVPLPIAVGIIYYLTCLLLLLSAIAYCYCLLEFPNLIAIGYCYTGYKCKLTTLCTCHIFGTQQQCQHVIATSPLARAMGIPGVPFYDLGAIAGFKRGRPTGKAQADARQMLP